MGAELIWILALVTAAAAMSWALTGCLRRYALATSLVDVPNERSSHVSTTPRGGGVAIVVTTLAAVGLLGWFGELAWPDTLALAGGGALIALVGFLDDHGHVAPRWRLLAHVVGASWLLIAIGGPPLVTVFGVSLPVGWIGFCAAALYVVWVINLTNFMDGIDGLASVEAITVSLAGAALIAVATPRKGAWLVPVVFACATAGFLFWNRPPAKIFMGDAGSGFLGFTLAALSLQAAWQSGPLLWSWLILLGVFVVDATMTLFRRVLRGERFYEAHRSHAYQHAARQAGGHRPVTLAVGVINICWLCPLAWLAARESIEGMTALLIAYAPLMTTALLFGAGTPTGVPVLGGLRALGPAIVRLLRALNAGRRVPS